MSDWPKVWVIIATYRRTETTLYTIRSLRDHLIYPNLHFHIADDGSGEADDGTARWHVGVLVDAISEFCPDVTWHEMDTPPGQFNFGGNVNQAIRAMQGNGGSIYMLNADDWALLHDLDIRPMVDVLSTYPEVGLMRLSYRTPGHGSLAVRYDCPRLDGAQYMWERLIREWSLHNPFGVVDSCLVSLQPCVVHMRMHEAYGWLPEHIQPGTTELAFNGQYVNSPLGESGPQILFPIGRCVSHAPWGHMVGRAHHYAAVT